MSFGSINQSRRTALGVGSLVLLLALTVATSVALLPGKSEAATQYQCVGGEVTLFDNWNVGAVDNGGTEPSFSTAGQPYCLISISTYHWNDGYGQSPGTIGLLSEDGSLGPWPATGSPGSPTEIYPEGVPNADWTVTVGAASQPVVINGSYVCDDSDPSSWSQNAASDGQGFCKVIVQPAEETTTTTTPGTTSTTSTTPTTPGDGGGNPLAGGGAKQGAGNVPCSCEDVSAEIVNFGYGHEGAGNGTAPLGGPVRIMFDLRWTLKCTQGNGGCKAKLEVVPPPGHNATVAITQTKDRECLTFTGPDGKQRPCPEHFTTPKPGVMVIKCNGPCSAKSTGEARVWIEGDDTLSAAKLANQRLVIELKRTCKGNGAAQRFVLNFGAEGQLLDKLPIK